MIFTKQTLTALQDRVYELEGLLQLAIDRDPCPEGIQKLISSKLREITETADNEPAADLFTTSAAPEAAHISAPEPAHVSVPEPEPVSAPQPAPAPVSEPKESVHEEIIIDETPATLHRSKPRFCLNDRFRFTRELFDGNADLFAQTVDKITEMESFEEAEEYFATRFNWDPENETAIDFSEILKVYFS